MLVAGIWGIAAIAGIITRDYTGLGIVTPVMMLVGGFLFAFKHEEKALNGERKDLSDW